MATPLSADVLVAALKHEGVTVVEHLGWRTHNRAGHGPWGPVHGVVIHHTVTSGTDGSVALCWNGRSDLPGPLCHGVIAKDGSVHLVGNGRTNHAGLGDGQVLAAVVAERPLPAPRVNDTDGNRSFYGFECVNMGDGKDPWPEAQLDAIERVSAAICRAHGWHAPSVIGHKEWTDLKDDPRGFSMDTLRSRIATRLGHAAAGTATPPPPAPAYQPYPGAEWFRKQPDSPIVTAMGRRLVAEGCSAYRVGPGPQWSQADRDSYAAWQRKLGYRGADADGWPGASSWAALKVPRTA
ncbi:peptidoglycan-binding protein [Actinacidiphila acidipaludis]|uniref:Peptidoglycan-binding protein n=1 Tax=Actinacidiphila acidipaludis TaxID=2873382 RepID=A0ABS7Q4I7_9ACTN|nr:peptidoglycan-binding protein [Streptomyces acidipaludis]MBY8878080.1 peptidoglycan-binding protein [Streptomyces acidipaludis]